MSRSVPEWRGKDENTSIPPRVKVRVFDRHGGKCAHCGRSIYGRLLACFDHIVALINGGENKESNLQLLCSECHTGKTKQDSHEKSVIYKKRLRHLGIKPKRRLIPGSKQDWRKRKLDGTVVDRRTGERIK